VIVVLNALMGLPPVVVGAADLPAAVALRPARAAGPAVHADRDGDRAGLLITPILAALTRQALEDAWEEYASSCARFGRRPRAPSRRCCGTAASRC
jgi:tungstate transport system permease protein